MNSSEEIALQQIRETKPCKYVSEFVCDMPSFCCNASAFRGKDSLIDVAANYVCCQGAILLAGNLGRDNRSCFKATLGPSSYAVAHPGHGDVLTVHSLALFTNSWLNMRIPDQMDNFSLTPEIEFSNMTPLEVVSCYYGIKMEKEKAEILGVEIAEVGMIITFTWILAAMVVLMMAGGGNDGSDGGEGEDYRDGNSNNEDDDLFGGGGGSSGGGDEDGRDNDEEEDADKGDAERNMYLDESSLSPEELLYLKKRFKKEQVPCVRCYLERRRYLSLNNSGIKTHYGARHNKLKIECGMCRNRFFTPEKLRIHRVFCHNKKSK